MSNTPDKRVICKTCGQTFSLSDEHDCPGLTSTPTSGEASAPPPLSERPIPAGVNCSDCGHRLPASYVGPCVQCGAVDGLTPAESGAGAREDVRAQFKCEMDALVRTAEASPYHTEGSRQTARAMRDAAIGAFDAARAALASSPTMREDG